MTWNFWLVPLTSLATYRLVRLAMFDTIFDRPRDWLYPQLVMAWTTKESRFAVFATAMLWVSAAVTHGSPVFAVAATAATLATLVLVAVLAGEWVLDMITCQWCLGVWMSAAVTALLATAVAAPWQVWVLHAAATAAGQSVVHLAEEVVETRFLGLGDQPQGRE